MATFVLARAFAHAVRQIGLIFDKENLPSYLSLSVLEHRIEKVEKAEQIVKALKGEFGDEKLKEAQEIVHRCKKLPDLVREWPLKKEDVEYYIDSMENLVAILGLLCEGDDQCLVFLMNQLFCKTDVGWHKPSSFEKVNQL